MYYRPGIQSTGRLNIRVMPEREREGRVVLGVRGVKAAKPFEAPKKTKKGPIPRVHATTKAARRAFFEAFSLFVAAYREAAQKLREGVRDVVLRWDPESVPVT